MVTAAVKRVRLSVARSMILDTMSEGGSDVSLSRSLRRSRTDPELREEVTRTGQPIVQVVRTRVELDRAEAILQRRPIPSRTSDDTSGVHAELARLEHAILLSTVRGLVEFGDPGPN